MQCNGNRGLWRVWKRQCEGGEVSVRNLPEAFQSPIIRVFLPKSSVSHASFVGDIAVSYAAELNGCSRLVLRYLYDERSAVIDV